MAETAGNNGAGYIGFLGPQDYASEASAHQSTIMRLLARIATSTLVRVVACTNSGSRSPAGTVDVMPLVNQVDGAGNAIQGGHGVIYGVPYSRLQGGTAAVIIDPVPGDIGLAVFASRDITTVVATKAQANPGSARMLSMSDALYIPALLNGTPTRFIRFSADGVEIVDPVQIRLSAPVIKLDAPSILVNTGAFDLVTHLHGGVQAGGDNTAGPVT